MKKRSPSRVGRPSSAGLAGSTFLASSPAGRSERFDFDPSKTWRRRRCEEIRVLSATERRYLLDLLAQIEASRGALSDELSISMRHVATSGLRRSARALSLLVERGMLVLSNKDGKLRGFLTEEGCRLINQWFAAQPPNFITRFPRLYRELGLCTDNLDSGATEHGVLRTQFSRKKGGCRARRG